MFLGLKFLGCFRNVQGLNAYMIRAVSNTNVVAKCNNFYSLFVIILTPPVASHGETKSAPWNKNYGVPYSSLSSALKKCCKIKTFLFGCTNSRVGNTEWGLTLVLIFTTTNINLPPLSHNAYRGPGSSIVKNYATGRVMYLDET